MTTPALPILLYHSIADDVPRPLAPFTVSIDRFQDHLDLIERLGFTAVSVKELQQHCSLRRPLPAKPVGITFDDGFEDFYVNAWPALRTRGMSGTLYVVSGMLGGRSQWLYRLGAGGVPMLSPEQLLQIAADGVEVGSHSVTHPELDNIDPRRAWHEISDSKHQLEDLLQQPVESFAYPHGHHTKNVRDMAVAAGYTSAVGVRNMISHRDDHLFALARVTIMADTTSADLERILSGQAYRRAPARELFRTKAARQVRRLRRLLG